MDEPRYNIRAVERQTGVPAATLRSWERRYGFPAPTRTASARRLYSEREVAAVRWVREQTERGLTAAQAVRWAQDGKPALPQAQASPLDATLPEVERALRAAVAYDEPALDRLLSEGLARRAPDAALVELFAPILVAIGERWAAGELPVSAEHFAAGVVQRRLLALLHAQPPLPAEAPVIIACVPGEQHVLGPLMLALLLRWSGLPVLFLGADVPAADLARCCQETGARAVCLSATSPGASAALRECVAVIRATGYGAPILAGGPAAVEAHLPGVLLPAGDLRAASAAIIHHLRGR